MQSVDEQGDQQDQANHQALDQPHFTLDRGVLAAHQRLKGGNRLLHGVYLLMSAVGQLAATLDLFAGALQFARVAFEQAVQFPFEGDAGVFGRAVALRLQAHQGGKVIGIRFTSGGDAKQRQFIERLGLGDHLLQLTLDFVRQFAAATADQLVAGQRQPREVQCGAQ
ncbi:hypothetical protein D3C80_898770 [compost metagenome]